MKNMFTNTVEAHRKMIYWMANEFDWDEYTIMWVAFGKGVFLTVGIVWLLS